MEIKTGGARSGRRIENAVKLIDYIESLPLNKMYGIQKLSKGITVLTKNEVITKELLSKKIEEKILELKKIADNSSDVIEKEIVKGMTAFILLFKKEILDKNIN